MGKSLVPVISITKEAITYLINGLQPVMQEGLARDDLIVAFLIGDIDFSTPYGNPFINISKVDYGLRDENEDEDEDTYFPNPHEPNQIAIRYNFYCDENAAKAEYENAQSLIYTYPIDEYNSFFQMICFSWFQDDDLVFKFVFPRPVYDVVFENIGPSRARLSNSAYPTFNIIEQRQDTIEAHFNGVDSENDLEAYILAISISQKYNVQNINAIIGNNAFAINVTKTEHVKTYNITMFSSGSTIIGSFGKISSSTAVDPEGEAPAVVKEQLVDIESKLNQMEKKLDEFKNEIKQSVQEQITTSFSEIAKLITDQLSNISASANHQSPPVPVTEKPIAQMPFSRSTKQKMRNTDSNQSSGFIYEDHIEPPEKASPKPKKAQTQPKSLPENQENISSKSKSPYLPPSGNFMNYNFDANISTPKDNSSSEKKNMPKIDAKYSAETNIFSAISPHQEHLDLKKEDKRPKPVPAQIEDLVEPSLKIEKEESISLPSYTPSVSLSVSKHSQAGLADPIPSFGSKPSKNEPSMSLYLDNELSVETRKLFKNINIDVTK